MIAFDATPPTIDASALLMFALSPANRAASDIAATFLHRHASPCIDCSGPAKLNAAFGSARKS